VTISPDPSFERLRQALYCGQPDRVPIAEITIDEAAKEAFLGKPVNDLSADLEFFLNAGYDYIILGRRTAGYPPIWDAARLDSYYEAQRTTARGLSAGVIGCWEDFRAYPWMKPSEIDFRILDEAERLLPAGTEIIRFVGPVFQMAWMLMGLDAFCYSLADAPGLAEAVMDRVFANTWAEVQDALQRETVGAIWYGDDIAIKSGLMVPPAFLRKALFPKLKMIGQACRDRGIPLIYHTDGDVSGVLDDIVEAGVNALHPIDPTGMNIVETKQALAGRMCVIGNVDVDLLIRGTPAQVRNETMRQIRLLAPGGGYVLGSSNSIPRAVRPENYRAMIETALAYGRYPIRDEVADD